MKRQMLSQNRQEHRCNDCRQMGHIARDCVFTTCTRCKVFGHNVQRCPETEAFKKIVMWFEKKLEVHCIVTNQATRHLADPKAHQFWVTLPQMRPYAQAGIALESINNRLKIDFDGACCVVITMQMPGCKTETLIFANRLRAKVSQKYIIEGAVLKEDTTRNATGAGNLSAPNADIYVTIVAEKLSQSLVILQLNERRYYLQWREIIEDGVPRQAVYMQSEQSFEHDQAFKIRPAIENAKDLFVPRSMRLPDSTMASPEPILQEKAKLQENVDASIVTEIHAQCSSRHCDNAQTELPCKAKSADIEQASKKTTAEEPTDMDMQITASVDDDPDIVIEQETIIFAGDNLQTDDSFDTADEDGEILVTTETEIVTAATSEREQ